MPLQSERGVRAIVLPVIDPDARRRWVVSVTPRPFYLGKRDPAPIIQGSGWFLGPIWMGLENLPPPPPRLPLAFEPLTPQPVAFRSADYAIPTAKMKIMCI